MERIEKTQPGKGGTTSARTGSALWRAPGGRAQTVLGLQRSAGNSALSGLLGTPEPAAQRIGPALSIQRDEEADAKRKAIHEQLRAVQGFAMFALLRALSTLPPEVRSDKAAGAFEGGPRLVLAMSAVAAKGTPWLDFAAANSSALAQLYPDQIADILTFLGAPVAVRMFGRERFDGLFDGIVDPAGGMITLVLRVRFEFQDALRFGLASPGTAEWERETAEGKRRYAPDFKAAVEAAWRSKGRVRPACPVGKVRDFGTQVRVEVVEQGEHALFVVVPAAGDGRANFGPKSHRGFLKPESLTPNTDVDKVVVDETGKHPVKVTTTQIPAVHEVGHALGLGHVRVTGGDNDANAGKTPIERHDVMGAGDRVQAIIRKGKIFHDDFVPFERIGAAWGKEFFPGALGAKCNVWTPVGDG